MWISQQLREPLPVIAGSTYVVVMDYVTEYAGKMNYFTKAKTIGALTIPAYGNVAGPAGKFPEDQFHAQVSHVNKAQLLNSGSFVHPSSLSLCMRFLPYRITGWMWSISRKLKRRQGQGRVLCLRCLK
jgi:hypothetical protein